jgi:hypothetical protein
MGTMVDAVDKKTLRKLYDRRVGIVARLVHDKVRAVQEDLDNIVGRDIRTGARLVVHGARLDLETCGTLMDIMADIDRLARDESPEAGDKLISRAWDPGKEKTP